MISFNDKELLYLFLNSFFNYPGGFSFASQETERPLCNRADYLRRSPCRSFYTMDDRSSAKVRLTMRIIGG